MSTCRIGGENFVSFSKLEKEERTKYMNKTQTWHEEALSLPCYSAPEKYFFIFTDHNPKKKILKNCRPFLLNRTKRSKVKWGR